jgi:hypothetical protein
VRTEPSEASEEPALPPIGLSKAAVAPTMQEHLPCKYAAQKCMAGGGIRHSVWGQVADHAKSVAPLAKNDCLRAMTRPFVGCSVLRLVASPTAHRHGRRSHAGADPCRPPAPQMSSAGGRSASFRQWLRAKSRKASGSVPPDSN